jgi:hypothetical protein
MSTKGPFGIEIDGSTTNKVWNANSTTANKTAYGDEDAYEAAVGEQLALIQKSQVGLIILSLFQNIGHKLTVVPYTDLDSYHQNDRCNSFPRPDDIRASHPNGQTWFNNPEGEDQRASRFEQSAAKGTGGGSDVKLHFTPGMWGDKDPKKRAPCDNGGRYGARADDVLVHELVHTLRKLEGNENAIPTEDKLRGYDDDEEFLAIVTTNVYISATKRNDQLRADHHGFKALAAPLNTSQGFLADPDNLTMLVKYYIDEADLYQMVALVTEAEAKFNPFRELVFNGATYRHPEIKSWYKGVLSPSR